MNRRFRPVALLLAAMAALACGTGNRGPAERAQAAPRGREGAASDTALRHLEARIRAHDFSIQNDLRGIGDAADPALSRLASDRDPEVRNLALLCLEVSGGKVAGKILGEALSDPSSDVRLTASQALYRASLPGALPYLVDAVRRNPDPGIRRNAALAAGKFPAAQAGELAQAGRAEKDPAVRLATVGARARLGDEGARKEFLAGLRAAEGQGRIEWLDRCEYIGQGWVLGALAPWLEDRSPARRIGADNMPGPEFLRVCDVVVNLAAASGHPRWGIKTGPARNYSDPELKEARRAWATLR